MATSLHIFLYFFPIIAFSVFLIRCNAAIVPLRGLQGVSPEKGLAVPIPLPVEGSCTAGDSFTINNVADLYSKGPLLECIFAAGKTPSDIPLGLGYGSLLSALNTGFWGPAAEIFYQGDAIVKTQCNGEYLNIGWLSIGGLDVGTSLWSFDDIEWELAPGEYPLGDEGYILMDFTVDFEELCPAEGNESASGLKGFSPFANSIYPLNQFRDVARHVGFDESDGGAIFLNKAYIYSATQGTYTVLVYALKSFDPKASKSLTPGEAIVVPLGPNGETTINYKRPGLDAMITRVIAALFNPAQLAKSVENRDAKRRAEAVSRIPGGKSLNVVNPFYALSVLAALASAPFANTPFTSTSIRNKVPESST